MSQLVLLERLRDMADPKRVGSHFNPLYGDAADEIERLQRIIDSRPAINAGLPETYIEWSQGIYVTDLVNVTQSTN